MFDRAGAKHTAKLDVIPETSPLNTDLYQLNMVQTYVERGMTQEAVFELFFRKLPARRQFLLAAGLETALALLRDMRFGSEEMAWLRGTGRFGPALFDFAERFRFTGDVDAVPEGTVVFPDEPVIRVTAPLPEAQLVETQLMNILHFQTVVASKAARMVLAAPDKLLVDFGLRRAHGFDAGVAAARAAYLAGFAGTATVLAGQRHGVPIYGTMAHSFIEAHDDETESFEAFARSHPDNVVLLIDTYDTERAAERVVALAPRLKRDGITIRGVRIDSGDLADHARKVRRILDNGGCRDVIVFASGGLDEDALVELSEGAAPIAGYGIGTSLTTSSDAPALDCAYKLQAYAGQPRRKLSEGKATWPGAKQVFRRTDAAGTMAGDVLTVSGEALPGTPLLVPFLRGGAPVGAAGDLEAARRRAAESLAGLPEPMRRLDPAARYDVEVSGSLRSLAAETDRRVRALARCG